MWVEVLRCQEDEGFDPYCYCMCGEPPHMPPCYHCQSCYLGERWEEEIPNITYLELFEEEIE